MKTLLVLSAVLSFTVCGVCADQSAPQENTAGKNTLRLQKNIFIPKDIYAVPGIEINIYFRNIFLAINHANYVFHVECTAGRNELKRWTFIPKAADAGKSLPLTVKVYDLEGLVAEGKTTVHIVPADAGKGKALSILMVGDSLTSQSVYPARLHQLCKQPGNPDLKMVGSHGINGPSRHPWGWHTPGDPLPGGVVHEGYGGWTWNAFLSLYTSDERYEKLTPQQRARARSKFVTMKNGKRELDIPGYFQKYNQGKAPDVITFQLGVNDIYAATPDTRSKKIEEILKNADKLIAAFRQAAPDAVIGVGFVTPGSNQDGFSRNNGCKYYSWDYYCNHFRLNQAMAEHFAKYKDAKLFMIPSNVNLDAENNLPVMPVTLNQHNKNKEIRQCNNVHPAVSGYNQMGDTYYAWLKYVLANPVKK